ncbi:6019_t:CDS:2 [Ambispora leptoticha]|uniref:6019_t:CDS:1 n=1 Tax=Ambispora leptoticha TaxID=144679 RepID=A0A9N9F9B4_9GLOM|nr:6019_t:CDS:2 [Ambispora leptoticha]
MNQPLQQPSQQLQPLPIHVNMVRYIIDEPLSTIIRRLLQIKMILRVYYLKLIGFMQSGKNVIHHVNRVVDVHLIRDIDSPILRGMNKTIVKEKFAV